MTCARVVLKTRGISLKLIVSFVSPIGTWVQFVHIVLFFLSDFVMSFVFLGVCGLEELIFSC